MRKTEKGRQRYIQTERQKMKEREREDTFSKPVFFSLINTLVFLPFMGVISSNSIAHFVINENVVLQINFNIFGYKLNTVSIICCRNRLLLQVACCNRLTKKNKQNCHPHSWHCRWQLSVEPSSQYIHSQCFQIVIDCRWKWRYICKYRNQPTSFLFITFIVRSSFCIVSYMYVAVVVMNFFFTQQYFAVCMFGTRRYVYIFV